MRARDARSSSLAVAQLVERCLQRGVELHVVQREADLAGQLGEDPVVVLGERRRRRRARDDDEAEQLAAVGDRPDDVASGSARSIKPGSHTASQVPPDTPARAITANSFGPIVSGGGV